MTGPRVTAWEPTEHTVTVLRGPGVEDDAAWADTVGRVSEFFSEWRVDVREADTLAVWTWTRPITVSFAVGVRDQLAVREGVRPLVTAGHTVRWHEQRSATL